jgi:hypothetical protein
MSDDPKKAAEDKETKTFVEGIDFYFEEGLMVLTRKYLLDRGFCCDSGCRHCPYREIEPA